jgi:signal transduction histidine kinase
MSTLGLLRKRASQILLSDDRWAPLRSQPSSSTSASPSELEERAFREHCAARLDRGARVCAIISILVALAWWPLDRFSFSRFPSTTLRPELYRLVIGAVCVLFLIWPRSPRFRRALVPLLCGGLAVGTGSFGYTAGLLGGIDQPWFHFAYPALNLPVIFPLTLRQRLAVTVAQTAGWLSGILVFHPDEINAKFLPATLSMTFLVCVAAVVFGHYAFVLFRDNFAKSRALARNAAELEDKVAQQTHALRYLLTHLDRARDEERAHISRELHDELGQELTALRYALGLTSDRFRQDPLGIANNLHEIEQLLARTTKTVRVLVGQLRPPVLEDLGLFAAVRWLLQKVDERGAIACQLDARGDDAAIAKTTAATAFRIIQETLTNVMRHANASRVEVEIVCSAQYVELRITDNGSGFSPEVETRGMGIRGMRERALALGSRLQISSTLGAGTEVSCRLPMVT